MVTVQVVRNSLPTFFSRMWGRTGNSVSASATAEVFNPSNSGAVGNGATGTITAVQPRCVKPWIIPNIDPLNPNDSCSNSATCNKFVDPLTGQVMHPGTTTSGGAPAASGVIGETFWIEPDCHHTGGTCRLRNGSPMPNWYSAAPPGVTAFLEPPPSVEYLPGEAPIATPVALPACASGNPYEEAIGGCDQSTVYHCGVQHSSLGNPNRVDLSENPSSGTNDTLNGVKCLIHETDETDTAPSGQDSMDLTSYPFKILSGTNNPMLGGALAGSAISNSPSVVSLPIYDPNADVISGSGISPVTIIGFLQVFINRVDPWGNVQVTVLNVAGCSNGTGTTLSEPRSLARRPFQSDSLQLRRRKSPSRFLTCSINWDLLIRACCCQAPSFQAEAGGTSCDPLSGCADGGRFESSSAAEVLAGALSFRICGSGMNAAPPSVLELRMTRSSCRGSFAALRIKKLNLEPFRSCPRTSAAGAGPRSTTTLSWSVPGASATWAPVRCCTADRTSDSVALFDLMVNNPSRNTTSSIGWGRSFYNLNRCRAGNVGRRDQARMCLRRRRQIIRSSDHWCAADYLNHHRSTIRKHLIGLRGFQVEHNARDRRLRLKQAEAYIFHFAAIHRLIAHFGAGNGVREIDHEPIRPGQHARLRHQSVAAFYFNLNRIFTAENFDPADGSLSMRSLRLCRSPRGQRHQEGSRQKNGHNNSRETVHAHLRASSYAGSRTTGIPRL